MAALRSILALSLGVLALHSRVVAQCPVPVGLDGGLCCAIATPNLPNFPNFAQDTFNICWLNCNVSQVLPVIAMWKHVKTFVVPSPPPSCGEMQMSLDITNAAGILLWSGTFRAVYSRTWFEAPGGPGGIQVWRWLVNGDLRSTAAAGLIPCPVPPCAPAFANRARFTGY